MANPTELCLRPPMPGDLPGVLAYRAEFLESGDSMDGTSNLRRYEDMKERWPEHEALLAAKCLEASLHVWTVALNNPPAVRKDCAGDLKAMAAFSQAHWQEVKEVLTLNGLGKMAVSLTRNPTAWAFLGAKILMKLSRMLS
jgi:hypothetical protein